MIHFSKRQLCSIFSIATPENLSTWFLSVIAQLQGYAEQAARSWRRMFAASHLFRGVLFLPTSRVGCLQVLGKSWMRQSCYEVENGSTVLFRLRGRGDSVDISGSHWWCQGAMDLSTLSKQCVYFVILQHSCEYHLRVHDGVSNSLEAVSTSCSRHLLGV